jgi:multiple sugar transport system substrate-binding protein
MKSQRHRRQLLRPIGIAAVAVVGVSALAACSAPSDAPSGEASSCEAIDLAVRSRSSADFEKAIQLFAEAEPGFTVSMQTLPDDNAQYQQAIVAMRLTDEMPDIVENIDTLVNSMAENKVTEDLVPWFGKQDDFTEETFLKQFLDAYRPLDLPEEIHGMPVSADAYVLYYNADLFEEYGVDLPTDDWTWEEFLSASNQITTQGAGQDFGLVLPNLPQPLFNPVIQSFGGYVYDNEAQTTGIGEPEAIEAWEFLLDPYMDGTYAPFEIASSPDAPGIASGRVAMAFSTKRLSTTLRDQLQAEWDVVPMPTLNGEHTTGGGSYGVSMTSASECKDQAWDFLKWFYENEGGMRVFQETYGAIPPTTDGIENGLWRELPPPPANTDAFATSSTGALMAPQLPRAAGGVFAEQILTATQRVLLEGVSVEDAFTEAANAVQQAIDEG